MVVRVEYYIDKAYFIKHKNAFREILSNLSFEITILKFEKQLTDRDITKKYNYSVLFVRKFLSKTCHILRKNGFKI